MPNGYDGSIRINTEITVKNAEKELGRLRSRMREMKDAKIPTEPYVKLQKEAGQASLKLAKLKALQDSLKKSGNMFSGQWRDLSEQSTEAIASIRNIKAEMRELERSGKSMQIIPAAEHDKILIEALTNEIGRAQEQFNRLIARGNRMKELGQDSGETWDKFQKELQNAATQIYNAQTRLDDFRKDMRTVEVPTEEYGELQKHLREWQDNFRNVKTEQESLRESGKQFSAEWLRTAKNIQTARAELRGIQNVMSGMENKGTAFLSGDKTEAFAKMAERAAVLEDKIAAGNAKLGQMYTRQKSVSASFGQIGKMADRLRSVLAGIGKAGATAFTALKNTASRAFLGINKEVKKSSGLFSTFASRLKGIALSLLIFNWITKAFNAMVSGMKQGFTNLMDYFSGFADEVQSIKNALSTLGNQFAAAFAPVVQMVIPWLRELIGMLTTAATYASMFFSLLAGKNTFTRAKQVQDSYNKSLDGPAASAKKAYGALARFDDLDVLQKREDETAGGAGSGVTKPEDMFEEVPIDSGMMDLFDRIKDLLSDFFRPLKEAWDKEGQFVMDSWKYALDEVWNLIKDIGRDFLAVWNQERTIQMFEDILHIIGDIGLVIGNLAHNLDEAWNKNQTGLHILENIRDLFAVIIEHIRNAADATVEWSKNLNFAPLLEAFERFTSALYPAVDAVSGILEDFYTDVLLPLGKWTLEKGLPELLDVLTGFLEKVDWEALRNNLKDFWEHLEPFAETVGEGLITFLERVSDLVAGFLNSETVMEFLDKLKEWMDSVTPEDVADGLKKLAEAILLFKVGSAVADTLVLLVENLAALKALGAFTVTVSIVLLGIEAFINWKKDLEYIQEHGLVEWQMKNRTEREDSPWNRYGHDADYDQNANSRFKSADENPWTKMVEENNQAWEEMQANEQQKRSEIEAERKKWWENARNQFSDAWTSLKESAATAWDNIKQTISEKLTSLKEGILLGWENIKQFFSDTWAGIKETAIEIWTGLQEWFGEFWTSFTENLSIVWENIKIFFSDTWNGIKENASAIWTAVTEFFSNTWENIKAAASTAWNAIKTFFQTTWTNIQTIATTIWTAIKTFMQTTWENVKTFAQNTWNNLKAFFINTWDFLKTKVDNVWTAIKTFMQTTWENVKTFAQNTWTNIKTMLTNVWDTIKEKAVSIWESIRRGFEEKINAVRDKMEEIKEKFDSFREKVFSVFENIKETVVSAIDAVTGAISGFIGLVESAISAIGSLISSAAGIGGSVGSAIGGFLGISSSGKSGDTRGTSLPWVMPAPSEIRLAHLKQALNTIQMPAETPSAIPSNIVRDFNVPNLAGSTIAGGNPARNIWTANPSRQTSVESQISAMQTAFENALEQSGLSGFGRASLHVHLDYNGAEFARVSIPDFLAEMNRQGYDVSSLGWT